MEEQYHHLLRSAARRLTGYQRRLFIAEVSVALCDGNARASEEMFGWGRETAQKGLLELKSGEPCSENFVARARPRTEVKNPQLAADIRAVVEPHTQADPELKSERRYLNLTAAEVRQALIKDKKYTGDILPSERTMRNILNRMNYRLRPIQKSKPLKKTKDTDAIFENVHAVHEASQEDPETLEISVDTKAKVALGDYSRGGKSRTDSAGELPKGWDHDPPSKKN